MESLGSVPANRTGTSWYHVVDKARMLHDVKKSQKKSEKIRRYLLFLAFVLPVN